MSTRRSSTADEIAGRLRGRIHRGELGPGDRLAPERELAADLDVARETLRAALARLQAEGYVEARRGAAGGSFVTALAVPYERWLGRMRADVADLADVMELRLAVERRAAELAAGRADDGDIARMSAAVERLDGAMTVEQFRAADTEFHSALAEASGSRRLVIAIDDARGELFAPSDQLRFELHVDSSRLQHLAILDAVRARDATAAAHAVVDHLETTRRQLLATLAPNGRDPCTTT